MEHALDLGVEVWSVPGPIDAPTCRGSNGLLADGARALASVEEFARLMSGAGDTGLAPAAAPAAPGGRDGTVLSLVPDSPVEVAEVAHGAGIPLHEALSVLAALEVRGWVVQLPGMRYRRAG